jgi:hypothetical protein
MGRFAHCRGVVGVVGLVVVASASATVNAAQDTAFTFHFKGRAGSAVLTDCAVGAPLGATCRAVSVFAFEQRVNADGDMSGSGPGMDVTLFDVVIVEQEPGYVATPVGQGFTDQASVRIDGGLSSGTASAADVPLCDFFDCEPGAVESVSVQMQWVGVGTVDRFKDHQMAADEFCMSNWHTKGTFRAADASGLVNGEVFVETVIPDLDATLQTDKFGSVDVCMPA